MIVTRENQEAGAGSRPAKRRGAMVAANDHESIRHICAQYCHYLDGTDGNQPIESLLDLFTDDGVLYSVRQSRLYEGREELRGFFAGVHSGSQGRSKHLTSNLVITVDGDAATVVSDWGYVREDASDGNSVLRLSSYGRFHDSFVRRASGWRFSSRVISRGNDSPAQVPGAE
jgi:ketosteroid isomerase-like protein